MKMNVSQEPIKSDDIFTVKKNTQKLFCYGWKVLFQLYNFDYKLQEKLYCNRELHQ